MKPTGGGQFTELRLGFDSLCVSAVCSISRNLPQRQRVARKFLGWSGVYQTPLLSGPAETFSYFKVCRFKMRSLLRTTVEVVVSLDG